MYQRQPQPEDIPGYAYGAPDLPSSTVTLEDLEKLKAAVMFGDDDVAALRMAGDVLSTQLDDILDVWYAFIEANPFLLHYFSTPDDRPINDYLQHVRARFGMWILDTCFRSYDQEWLDYQYEIAQRHYSTKKNKTDHVDSTPLINYHYIVALIYPITATVKPFLSNRGHSADEVERMYNAWFKSVTMQVALWGVPFVKAGAF
ncbi:MAG: Protoglobin [bacterium ADurb.Bin429]|nr:MAG: Protoglobin [bacterium ADurb.Bin429]